MGDYGAALGFHTSTMAKVQCKGTTDAGARCRRFLWVVQIHDPLYCYQHLHQIPAEETTMPKNPFEPGDFADHKSGELDPREVAKVEGDQIWLYFFGPEPQGPFPAENYDRQPASKGP